MELDTSKLLVKIKSCFAGEVIFAFFILAGNFKTALAFIPDFIDFTIFLLGWSMLIALKRLYVRSTLPKGSIEAIILFGMFVAVISASLFYSSSSIYAIDKTLRFLIITGWSYMGVFFLIKDEVSIRKFLNGLIFIGLIMSASAIFEIITNMQGGQLSFVSVMGSNYLALGRVLGVSVLVLMNLYLVNEKNKIKNIFIVLIIIQMVIALLASGGRMPFLSLVLVFIIYFAISFKFNGRKIVIRKDTKKVAIFLVFTTLIIIVLVQLGMFDVMIRRILSLFQQEGGGTSATARWMRYLAAVSMWEQKLVIGNGVGSFPIFFSGIDLRDYPHNIFLEIVCELGIVGLGVFILLIGNCLYKGWIVFKQKFKQIDSLQLTLLLVFIYLIINANISGDLNDNRLMFSFCSLLSISPYIEKEVNGDNENLYINNRS